MMGQNRPMAQGAGPGAMPSRVASPVLDPRAFSTDDYRQELKRVKRKQRIIIALCVVLALIVALVVAAVVVLRVPGSLHSVESDEMTPVLVRGDVALTQEIESPARGDVIMYYDTTGAKHVARVVASAGEWANVASDETVVVSDGPLESAAAAGVVGDGATIIASRQVPAGSCFVMTDADGQALEALYQEDHFIDFTDVLGRVSFRMWPITRIGSVN